MKIYNNLGGTLRHETDRLPKTEEDVRYLAKMFPNCVIRRKTTGKSIFISEMKVKNAHWYE